MIAMGLFDAANRLDNRVLGKPESERAWRFNAKATIPTLLLMMLLSVLGAVEKAYFLPVLAVWGSFWLGYHRRRAEEVLGLRPWNVGRQPGPI